MGGELERVYLEKISQGGPLFRTEWSTASIFGVLRIIQNQVYKLLAGMILKIAL